MYYYYPDDTSSSSSSDSYSVYSYPSHQHLPYSRPAPPTRYPTHRVPVYSDTYSNCSSDMDERMALKDYRGQLQLLAYQNTTMLTIKVLAAKHLKSEEVTTCNACVKLGLVPDETQRTRCKTDTISDTNDPVFNEYFSVELLEGDENKRLYLSVWNNKSSSLKRCEFIGCMSFGLRGILNGTKKVEGWFYLLASETGQRKHLNVKQNKIRLPSSVNLKDAVWVDGVVRQFVVRRVNPSSYGFTITNSAPVRVGRVESGSNAEQVGLKSGDMIMSIDGVAVRNCSGETVAKVIKNSMSQIFLEIRRQDQLPLAIPTLPHSPVRRRQQQPSSPSRHHPYGNSPRQMMKAQRQTVRQMEVPVLACSPGSLQKRNYGWLDGTPPPNMEVIEVQKDVPLIGKENLYQKETQGIRRRSDSLGAADIYVSDTGAIRRKIQTLSKPPLAPSHVLAPSSSRPPIDTYMSDAGAIRRHRATGNVYTSEPTAAPFNRESIQYCTMRRRDHNVYQEMRLPGAIPQKQSEVFFTDDLYQVTPDSAYSSDNGGIPVKKPPVPTKQPMVTHFL